MSRLFEGSPVHPAGEDPGPGVSGW